MREFKKTLIVVNHLNQKPNLALGRAIQPWNSINLLFTFAFEISFYYLLSWTTIHVENNILTTLLLITILYTCRFRPSTWIIGLCRIMLLGYLFYCLLVVTSDLGKSQCVAVFCRFLVVFDWLVVWFLVVFDFRWFHFVFLVGPILNMIMFAPPHHLLISLLVCFLDVGRPVTYVRD